jgi:hypothetical protein
MISPQEIQKIAKQWNIADFIIENDYVLLIFEKSKSINPASQF